MYIDYDRLRNDLENESLGAFYGTGFGGALIQSFDVQNASDDELIEMAERANFNLNKYRY
jgi:hypothetical protein